MNSRVILFSGLFFCLTGAELAARDVYGNDTAWSNADTAIDNIHTARRREERRPEWWRKMGAPPPPISWEDQESRRRQQQRENDRREWERDDYESVRYRPRPPAPPREKPPADWQVFELYRKASAKGSNPDPALAAKHLAEAVRLGHFEARLIQAQSFLFGDRANGIAQDAAKGEALLNRLSGEIDDGASVGCAQLAGETLFKEYYLGTHLPADPAKAIAITRKMRTIKIFQQPISLWQEERFAELLLAEGWEKNHAEIIDSMKRRHRYMQSIPVCERLVRIYLGLDPEVARFVPINPRQARYYLHTLSQLSPARARDYLPVFLNPGPAQDLAQACEVVERFHQLDPMYPLWVSLHADILNKRYGGDFAPELFKNYLAGLDAPGLEPAELLASARVFAGGGESFPADPARAVATYRRLLKAPGVKMHDAVYCASRMELAQLLADTGGEDAAGVIALIKEAAGGFDRFAQRDGARAIYRLRGVIRLTELDEGYAFSYAKISADSGDMWARMLLSEFYRVGFGTGRDPEKALEISQKYADQDIPAAYTGLARVYLMADTPLHDPAAGFRAATKAVELGDGRAWLLVAICHRNGWGTPVDEAKFAEAMKRSLDYPSGL